MVVNGQPVTIKATEQEKLAEVRRRALTETENVAQPPENWEIKDEAGAVPPPPPGHPLPPPSPLRMDARISQNHGHVFAVSIDDVGAAVDRTYDLSGTSGHKHEVTLTKALEGRREL